MSVARRRWLVLAAVSVAVALGSAVTGFAQGQAEPPTIRDYCIKVAPGKGAEFEAFLKDVAVPLAQARADAGEFDWLVVASSVVPAGSSATCDYRVVYGYKGLPPEPPSNEALAAALKRAKLAMTVDQVVARRNAVTQLVGVDIWFHIDGTGAPVEKGNYVQVNHYDVRYGETAEWVRLEKTYWKAIMDAWLKAGGKGSWGVYGLWRPTGDSTPYDSLTVDVFADWASMVRGVPLDELWPKTHPDTAASDVFNRLEKVRSVHDREIYEVVEVVRAK
jgi:hypothetical protein